MNVTSIPFAPLLVKTPTETPQLLALNSLFCCQSENIGTTQFAKTEGHIFSLLLLQHIEKVIMKYYKSVQILCCFLCDMETFNPGF